MANIIKYKNLYPSIHEKSLIAHNAILTGDVTTGINSNIWFGCVLRGDLAPIKIGDGTNIQDLSLIHVSRPNHPNNKSGPDGGACIIGNGVTVGHQATLHACTIEDYAFIGMQAVVLDMSIVETGAMVAAGAVVPPKKIVKSGEIWAGNPAKFLRKLSESEQAYFKQSELNYIELAKEYFSYNK